MKEHNFQIQRDHSRLRNSVGEGPLVAKKCISEETHPKLGLRTCQSVKLEFVRGGGGRDKQGVEGGETGFYSQCKEKPPKVFQQGNGITYVLRRSLWKEKLTVAEVWRTDCRRLRREARPVRRLLELLIGKRKGS